MSSSGDKLAAGWGTQQDEVSGWGAWLVARIPGHWPAALPGRPQHRLVPPWKRRHPKPVLLAPMSVCGAQGVSPTWGPRAGLGQGEGEDF